MIKCEQCGYSTHSSVLPLKCSCGYTTRHLSTTTDQPTATAWPRWAKLLRRLRKPADSGVGDTAQRLAALVGGERFKAWSARIGMPCRCTDRQDEWNKRFPYDR